MALTVNFTLAGGSNVVSAIINRIAYIEEDLSDATTCLVGLVTGAVSSRVRVVGAPATVAAAVATAAGAVVSGQVYAPLIVLTQAGDGARLWVQYATVAGVFDDPATAGQSYIDTAGCEGRWLVVAARATIVTALVAAAAATPVPASAASRLVLQAVMYGGAIQSQTSDVGVTLSLTSPYVPGSGVDHLTLGGTNVPTNYAITPVSEQAPCSWVARQTGAGLPTFIVAANLTDRAIGVLQADVLGTVLGGSWGFTGSFSSGGAGINTYELSAAPFGGVFSGTGSLTTAAGTVDVERVDATHVKVTTRDAAGAATAAACDVTLTGLDSAGSQGYQPAEGPYVLQVWSLD